MTRVAFQSIHSIFFVKLLGMTFFTFEAFDEIHKVVLDGIIENTSSLYQSGMCDAINTDDTTTNGLYVIQFLSEAYTLQNNTTIDGQVISAGELVVNEQYLYSTQENSNWY